MDAEQTKVYVPDAGVGWVEATITKGHVVNDTTVEVVLAGDDAEEDRTKHPEAGTIRTVEKKSLFLQNATLGDEGCEDMVHLNYLHEPAILFNLRQRFFRQRPYTYTGPICIAVNPYAWLDLYTPTLQEQYLTRDRSELPPHVYATSAGGYQHMRVFGEDQSILVSGESGAGKTETTKILMSHLARAGNNTAGTDTATGGAEKSIIDRVLHANPLMESFGNAKTSRNDNSSRFGKFSELQFNTLGQLIGARSRTYLLEKSRVSIQGHGERNYHIFYQLLAGPAATTAAVLLGGRSPADFPFLTGSGSGAEEIAAESATLKDAKRFEQTVSCLETLGVHKDTQVEIFKIVSVILHLSRLAIEAQERDDDASRFAVDSTNKATQATICQLLGVATADLETALCSRQMSLSASESYQVPLNASQAQGVRTALAVALYSHLFQWLIHRVNASTTAHHADIVNKICILDIFGFEIFEKNSFEQLCINYANEKLQQKFTQDVFKTIQSEYEDEGIPWTKIEFADNANVLALIEGRFGLLSLLNEECMRPKGNDAAFASKLKAHYADNDRFETPRFAREAFTIKHYAGPVEYDAAGFLLKNTDALQNDLLVLVTKKSSSPFVQELFSDENKQQDAAANAAATTGRGGHAALKRRTSIIADTVGTQFKSQLNGLMEDIRRTNVHYIRCIKPNSQKSPATFCKQRVTEQLQCAGVVEAVRISRMAFPNRMLQTLFLERFRGLAAGTIAPILGTSDDAAVAAASRELLERHLLPDQPGEYQLGKTRIFFRKGILEGLEERRSRKLNEAAVILQRYAKKWRALAAFQAIRRAAVTVQATFRGYAARTRYRRQRTSAIRIQSVFRGHRAQLLLVAMRKHHRATQIQNVFKMHVCRTRYRKIQRAILVIQSIIRMFNAVRAYVVLQEQAQEDAKLENQIRNLKRRLQEEREARMELEQGYRSSILIRNEEALEGADEVIDQLRRENATLKEANSNLKAFNVQLRKEKEVMERGAYVNGASFAAANQRAIKLQEEVEVLKTAHTRIKSTHRVLKDQNLAAIEKVSMMQASLNEALTERNVLRQTIEHLHKHAERMQGENESLAKANARLRLILRQDPELSRKHREEVPRLTKLAFAQKQTLLPKAAKAALQQQQQQSPYAYLYPPAPPMAPPQPKASPLKSVDLSAAAGIKVSMDPPHPRPSSPVQPTPGASLAPLKQQQPRGSIGASSLAGALSAPQVKKQESSKTLRVVNLRDIHETAEAGEQSGSPKFTITVGAGTSSGSPKAQSPKAAATTAAAGGVIRQPTGADGPLLEPAKLMGLVASEDTEEERVSFSVTLSVDAAEEAKKEKERASLTSTKGFGNKVGGGGGGGGGGGPNKTPNKGRGRRGSYDNGNGDGRYLRRGSSDSQDRDRSSSLRQSFTGGANRASFTGGGGYEPMRNSSLRATFNGGAPSNPMGHVGGSYPQQHHHQQQPHHGRGRRGSYDRGNSFNKGGPVGPGAAQAPPGAVSSAAPGATTNTTLGRGGKHVEL